MKKIFFSVLAIAAIAACSKSEVQYEQSAEIGLAPVSKLNTKAAVVDAKYPQGLDMYVFANAGEGDDLSAYTAYFRNGSFKHKADGVFSGNPTPYYWPNVKKLIFSGVSASGNVNKTIEVTPASGDTPAVTIAPSVPTYSYFEGSSDPAKSAEWQITLENYTPYIGTAANGDNDLMWFSTVGPYARPGKIGVDNDKDVNVQMEHACAWVTIIMKGDGVTAGANTAWEITNLDILSLSQKGTAVLGSKAEWKDLALAENVTIFKHDGLALTQDGEDYTKKDIKDLVVIPQEDKTLKISYKFVSQKANPAAGTNEDIVVNEEITVDLTSNTGTWDAGKHYTYTITMTAEEILVEPTVKVWETESHDHKYPQPEVNP